MAKRISSHWRRAGDELTEVLRKNLDRASHGKQPKWRWLPSALTSVIDAHFQLGRIGREQGRPQEALDHFGEVISRDDKHSQSEIWREIGATYQAVSMWEDARQALERFLERRPFDAEGLYRMADVASKLNEPEKSREMLERCVDAVKTMPYYRRGEVRKWGKLAQKGMQELGSGI